MKKLILPKWLLVSIGILAVGLGIAGIFVPLLPTTPFLLLGAACFARSSEKLYRWLMGHKWLGPYIKNYREHRAIAPQVRAIVLLVLWGTIGYSALVVVDALIIRVLLVGVAIGVTVHLIKLKTLTPDMLSGSETTLETQEEET